MMKEYIVSADIRTQEMMGLLSKYEIVRCRDCKYMETRGLRCYCAAHAGGYPEVSHDDFCSFGERKKVEG